jgi:hypothetical protein
MVGVTTLAVDDTAAVGETSRMTFVVVSSGQGILLTVSKVGLAERARRRRACGRSLLVTVERGLEVGEWQMMSSCTALGKNKEAGVEM